MNKRLRGSEAELLARTWLESHEYTFRQSNFTRRVGEIDLIFNHPNGKTIIFVEVRYRSHVFFGGALSSIDYRKQRKLIRTANAWLQRYADSTTAARIDVIGLGPLTTQTEASQTWKGHHLVWIKNAIEE